MTQTIVNRLWLLLAALSLSTLACNFAARQPTPLPPPSPTVFSNPGGFATQTPLVQPTRTAAPTSTSAVVVRQPTAVVVLPSCTPRNDWPYYIVVAGDTLNIIARRTGTTSAVLATANCLANPDVLAAGQALRVPYIPPTPVVPTPFVPTPGSYNRECIHTNESGNGVVSPIMIAPSLEFNGSCYVLQAGTTITIAWPNLGSDFQEVVFYRYNADMMNTDVIGTDQDPSDGAWIQWYVNPDMPPSAIWAIAYIGQHNSQDAPAVGYVVVPY